MRLEWIYEKPARWDSAKQSIVGGSPEGIFRKPGWEDGQLIPGDWWRVERAGETIGYGWMEIDWVEAEVLLAVAPDVQKHGVGSFIVEALASEAAERGVNYMANVVRETHPDREGITRWLGARGFKQSMDDDRLVRRVQATGARTPR